MAVLALALELHHQLQLWLGGRDCVNLLATRDSNPHTLSLPLYKTLTGAIPYAGVPIWRVIHDHLLQIQLTKNTIRRNIMIPPATKPIAMHQSLPLPLFSLPCSRGLRGTCRTKAGSSGALLRRLIFAYLSIRFARYPSCTTILWNVNYNIMFFYSRLAFLSHPVSVGCFIFKLLSLESLLLLLRSFLTLAATC